MLPGLETGKGKDSGLRAPPPLPAALASAGSSKLWVIFTAAGLSPALAPHTDCTPMFCWLVRLPDMILQWRCITGLSPAAEGRADDREGRDGSAAAGLLPEGAATHLPPGRRAHPVRVRRQ